MYSRRLKINFESTTCEEQHDNFKIAIIQAATDSGMLGKPNLGIKKGSAASRKPWVDHEVIQAKAKVSKALRKCRNREYEHSAAAAYRTAKNDYRTLLAAKKIAHNENIKIKLANVGNPSDFWKIVKDCRWQKFTRNAVPMTRWEEFYKNTYPPRVGDSLTLEEVPIRELDEPISLEKLNKAITNCKNAKSPGPDQILNEQFKELPQNWRLYLLTLFNKVLERETVPEAWPRAALTMLFKKGDKNEPGNYRGIALINNILKLFTRILHVRIDKWASDGNILPEIQAGFRSGRSCVDQVFTLITTIQMQLRHEDNVVFAIFVDFKRAFDSIPHSLLWRKLASLGLSSKNAEDIKKYL